MLIKFVAVSALLTPLRAALKTMSVMTTHATKEAIFHFDIFIFVMLLDFCVCYVDFYFYFA